jgi:hypothetical protein
MISGVVFSKDRAAQLHLALHSIRKNFSSLGDITVLYTATTSDFEDGYKIAQGYFPAAERVNWVKQDDFQKDTLRIVENSQEYICFFTDDDIMYRSVETSVESITNLFEKQPKIFTLSLRLGGNTYVQNIWTGQPCQLPEKTAVINEYVIWKWGDMSPWGNFGYPFSVDGHIFRSADVLKIISQYEFETPNALEGRGMAFLEDMQHLMASYTHSCLVNTPLNIVGSSENCSGVHYGLSLDEFNTKYLNREVPDFEAMDFSDITASHQEVKVEFK